jgi:hypothetical protein
LLERSRVTHLKKAVLPAATSPTRQTLMVREATIDDGAPADAAVPEPTRKSRTPKGEKGRGTGEGAAEAAATLLAVRAAAADAAGPGAKEGREGAAGPGEKEKAEVGGAGEVVAAVVVVMVPTAPAVLSARLRLMREKVRWKTAPTRLLLVAGLSRAASSLSSSSVGWEGVSG